ncbi:MAG TPA: DUF3592 domain-containing protein [Pirellulales bacterium]|nr:DUF3592 domain-containing protein [Pirellulales bacterium]
MATIEPSEIEPELRNTPPRDVRLRFRLYFARALFAALALGLPAVLLFVGFVSDRNRNELKQHGIRTTAHVVQKRRGTDGGLPSIQYRYAVDGQSHEGWRTVNNATYANTKLDDLLEIAYRPDRPDWSRAVADLESGGSDLAPLGLVAAIMFLVMGGTWYYSERRQARLVWLLRHGSPTRTTELQTWQSALGAMMFIWNAEYAFVANEQTYRRRTTFLPSAGDPLRKPTGPATVLYDPHDPTREVLYPTIARLFRIVPSE